MSFCNGPVSDQMPGEIVGNPLNGLCDKVCIEVKKVFDAALKQVQLEDISITLTNPNPPNPTQPLTFVSCRSSSSRGIISNLAIDRLPDRGRQARVRCTVSVPMQCVYVDALDVEGVADGFINIAVDIVMCVPEQSIMPFEVEAVVSGVCPEGQITASVARVTACVTMILKIVIETELLIPSYGYCEIPPAQEFSGSVCAGFFELPLYPTNNT